MRIGEVEIKWLGHAGFMIKNSRVIYIDPYNIKEGLEKSKNKLIRKKERLEGQLRPELPW